MDWTAGYASDIEYTAGFYREQGPSYLNFVCALSGVEPVPLDQPFTYFELGFGRGLTVNLLAASNPQGRFYAADFNPAHVAGAREMAASAGLENLTLYEDSFEDLANGSQPALPQCDFITLHGIYTWVTAENQQHIVKFISRYLKPGGLVFMSYNALPGWAAALPLQRLLVEYGDAFPNRSDLQVKGAADLVTRMEAANASYFVGNPGLKPRLDMLKAGSANYLVHEYMHKHWEPRYHADVARDMAAAKLEYVGSADLSLSYPKLFLSPEKEELVNTMSSAAMRETMKDYFLNTGFRKDIFVRGARKMSPLRQSECLQQVGVALTMPLSRVTLELKLTIGQVSGKEEVYRPVLAALAQHPHTLGELQVLLAPNAPALHDLAQAAALLVASGQAEVYWGSAAGELRKAHGMNQAISRQALYGDEYGSLCSPLLGNGIATPFIERLVYRALPANGADFDPGAIVAAVWKILQGQGRKLVKDGVACKTDSDNIAELGSQVRAILKDRLPLWRQLKML